MTEQLDADSKDRLMWLRSVIQSKSITKPSTQLAEKTGYTVAAISNYLNMKRPITIAFVQAVEKAYKVQYSQGIILSPNPKTPLDRVKEMIYLLKQTGAISSLNELADKMGYSRQGSISEILSGRSSLSDKFILSFCSIFSVNKEYITAASLPKRIYSVQVDERSHRVLTSLSNKSGKNKIDLLSELIDAYSEAINRPTPCNNSAFQIVRIKAAS